MTKLLLVVGWTRIKCHLMWLVRSTYVVMFHLMFRYVLEPFVPDLVMFRERNIKKSWDIMPNKSSWWGVSELEKLADGSTSHTLLVVSRYVYLCYGRVEYLSVQDTLSSGIPVDKW